MVETAGSFSSTFSQKTLSNPFLSKLIRKLSSYSSHMQFSFGRDIPMFKSIHSFYSGSEYQQILDPPLTYQTHYAKKV